MLLSIPISNILFSSRKNFKRPRPGQVRPQWTHPKFWRTTMILNLKHLKLDEINLLEIKWKKNRKKSRKRPEIKKLWEQSTEQLLATCLPVSFPTQTLPRITRILTIWNFSGSGILSFQQTLKLIVANTKTENPLNKIRAIITQNPLFSDRPLVDP